MLFWIYNLSLFAIFPVAYGFMCFKCIFKSKRSPATFFVLPKAYNKKSIWIHAVSLGEVNTAKPLIESLQALYPQHQICLSTVTETGLYEACKIANIIPFYLPYDFYFLQSRLIKKIDPVCVIYIEGDIWPSMTNLLKKKAIPQIIVSGKLSENSYQRLKVSSAIAKLLYGSIDLFLLQDESSRSKFLALNIDEDKLIITGNLKSVMQKQIKFEEQLENRIEKFLNLNKFKKTVVLSCTHEGEEGLLLDLLQPILGQINLIIAPRHPQRFQKVQDLLSQRKLNFSSFSSVVSLQNQILLLDTIGALQSVYKQADLVILGGSFVRGIGGHNVMEPIYQHCPVIVGPYTYSQTNLTCQMVDNKIGIISSSETLVMDVNSVLNDVSFKSRIDEFIHKKSEVLEDTLKYLFPILEKSWL